MEKKKLEVMLLACLLMPHCGLASDSFAKIPNDFDIFIPDL